MAGFKTLSIANLLQPLTISCLNIAKRLSSAHEYNPQFLKLGVSHLSSMREGALSVNNFKVHFEVKNSYLLKLIEKLTALTNSLKAKSYHNFIVIPASTTKAEVYTIFTSRGYVNATGIKTYKALSCIIKSFCALCELSEECFYTLVTVDNLTASGKFRRSVDLHYLTVQAGRDYICRFNPAIFPGVSIKIPNRGTILVFASGKFTIVAT